MLSPAMQIRAFQGLRPSRESVPHVASLPYDVVTREEAHALACENPLSFLHVVRAEVDLPEETDPYDDVVYRKAVENFGALQKQGHLVREEQPCLYVYQQQFGKHVQQGVVALCHVDDYRDNIIRKHEKTRKAKEDDRTRLASELSAHVGPVFLTYRDQPDIDRLLAQTTAGQNLFDFVAEDGVRHTVWQISAPKAWEESFRNVPFAYVADGHHRSASAARVGEERKAANPRHTGAEDYNGFLTVLFPASQLKILAYNRLIKDLNGLEKEAFLDRLCQLGAVKGNVSPDPARPGQIHCYLDGRWYCLELKAGRDDDPVSRLDVSMLQERVFRPVLGIEDPRTDERIAFIGGIESAKELAGKVDAGLFAVGFSLYPVRVEELMSIADAGQIMPPKSTWFEPKLRSGLFVHTFEKAFAPVSGLGA